MDIQHITHCRHFENHPRELPPIVEQMTGALTRRLFARLVAFSQPGDGAIILYILTYISLYAKEWLPKQHLFEFSREDAGTRITLRLCSGKVQTAHWYPMLFDFQLEELIILLHVIDEHFPNLFEIEHATDDNGTVTGLTMVRNTTFGHQAKTLPPECTEQGEAERFLAALIQASLLPNEDRDASYVRNFLKSGKRIERRTTIPAEGPEEDPSEGSQAVNNA